MDPIKTERRNKLEKDFDEVCKELVELSKRLNVQIVIGNRPTFRPKQYMIRFTMKRRWGGVKKYAYECTRKPEDVCRADRESWRKDYRYRIKAFDKKI